MSQYAGQDKWQAEIRCQEQLEFGKDRVIFHLKTSFPNTGMPLPPCKPVQSMCSINSQMNTQELDFYLKQFNALILDSKLPWQASRLTMALKA